MWSYLRLWYRQLRTSERAAPKELAKLTTEIEHGYVATGHPLSLGDLVQRWLDGIGPWRAIHAQTVPSRAALNSWVLYADTHPKDGPTAT
jgi:hypothetical protein